MIKPAIRQRWDMVNDRPSLVPKTMAQEYLEYQRANAAPIPEYRAKLVTLNDGQFEVSVTPTDKRSVINHRMGFNPLLDCRRREKTEEERARRDIENKARSAKLARQNVRLKVKQIQADHLLTFSYRENVKDRDKLARDWKEFVRLYQIRYPEWPYIGTPEKHDSEETSEEKRGAYHFHVAVHGRQDIRWLRRCWLLAIGQSKEDVNAWLIDGHALGDKSMGAVNVEPPKRRWGNNPSWTKEKLAAYMSKYIGKDFDDTPKGAKRYWASRNIAKPLIERFWLRAKDYRAAIIEAHDMLYYRGVDDLHMWGNSKAGVLWFTGYTDRENIGKTTQYIPDLDLLQ